ncbi:MAG: NAD(P)-dependent oxidoreductase [Aliidongia sp.]
MKPDAWLVNTSRGPILEEAALIAALTERRIGGAAIDVYDTEPLPVDPSLPVGPESAGDAAYRLRHGADVPDLLRRYGAEHRRLARRHGLSDGNIAVVNGIDSGTQAETAQAKAPRPPSERGCASSSRSRIGLRVPRRPFDRGSGVARANRSAATLRRHEVLQDGGDHHVAVLHLVIFDHVGLAARNEDDDRSA